MAQGREVGDSLKPLMEAGDRMHEDGRHPGYFCNQLLLNPDQNMGGWQD